MSNMCPNKLEKPPMLYSPSIGCKPRDHGESKNRVGTTRILDMAIRQISYVAPEHRPRPVLNCN